MATSCSSWIEQSSGCNQVRNSRWRNRRRRICVCTTYFNKPPQSIQEQAREADRLFQENPAYPSLPFKSLENEAPPGLYILVGAHYRPAGVRERTPYIGGGVVLMRSSLTFSQNYIFLLIPSFPLIHPPGHNPRDRRSLRQTLPMVAGHADPPLLSMVCRWTACSCPDPRARAHRLKQLQTCCPARCTMALTLPRLTCTPGSSCRPL